MAIDGMQRETKKQKLQKLLNQLDYQRSTFIPHWQAIADNISPRRPQLCGNETNRGGRKNNNIIDFSATLAERTLMSGMMAGITSPAREWFRLTTQDPDLAEQSEVKDWLAVVTDRMNTVFSRSNLYNQLPMIYGDGGTFGTGVMMVEEDFETVFRSRSFEVGSYYLANDSKGDPEVFMRQYQMTVRQLVEEFAEKDPKGRPNSLENFSERTQELYRSGRLETQVSVIHAIYPNPDFDGVGNSSRTKRFSSCYYEGWGTTSGGASGGSDGLGGVNGAFAEQDLFLRESGYDMFPILVFRWGVRSQDAYGTSCPGMIVVGAVAAIQLMHKRKAQAIELKVRPPMNAPISMKQSANTTIAGGINWIPDEAGDKSFKPTFEINFDTRELSEYMIEIKQSIEEAYFVPLFNSVLNDFRSQPRTAEEMRQLAEEKLSMLGPVLEQANLFLNRLIDLTFDIMRRQHLIPDPPDQLSNQPLRVEYVSILAQAQKSLGIGSVERYVGNVMNIAQAEPSILDVVNFDVVARKLSDMSGIPHGINRDEDEVIKVRQAKAQQAQAQQAQSQMADSVKATRDLAETPMDQGSALDRLVEQARAGQLAQTG